MMYTVFYIQPGKRTYIRKMLAIVSVNEYNSRRKKEIGYSSACIGKMQNKRKEIHKT